MRPNRASPQATARAYIEPEEIALMEQAATNLCDRLLVRVVFRLGCRVSKALALAPDDIDFDHGSVTIMHLKARIQLCCPHCSVRLGRSHTFCPHCGAKVDSSAAEIPPPEDTTY